MTKNDFVSAVVNEFEKVFRVNAVDHIGAMVLQGSRAAGLETAESDYDIRGWYFLPEDMLFGLGRKDTFSFEEIIVDDQGKTAKIDVVLHSLPKFLSLLIQGSPQAVETLSVVEPMVWFNSPAHKDLVKKARIFRNDKYVRNILAMADKFVRVGSKVSVSSKDAKQIMRLLYYAGQVIRQSTFSLKMDKKQRMIFYQLAADRINMDHVLSAIIKLATSVERQYEENKDILARTDGEYAQLQRWAVNSQREFYELYQLLDQNASPGNASVCRTCVAAQWVAQH